jgi:hypothetical protein
MNQPRGNSLGPRPYSSAVAMITPLHIREFRKYSDGSLGEHVFGPIQHLSGAHGSIIQL